ncbi:MAG: LytTR family DNA-binding domain-containing protein [Paludibacter sp.]
MQPLLTNTTKTLQYFLLWMVYGIIQTIVLSSLTSIHSWVLWVDGFVHTALLAAIGLILWNVIKFGNFGALTLYQRLVNQIALAVLSLGLWLGGGYGIIYLIAGEEITSKLIPLLPIRGLLGLLIYLIILLYFRNTVLSATTTEEIIDAQVNNEDKKPTKTSDIELLERIAVKSGTKIHVLLVPDILYLQADGDYVQIFTREGKYLKEQTMKYFEEHLPENQFVRVHRSLIVNVEMISRIELYEKQNQLLTLKNGQQIKTSPSGYKALRMALNL